METETETLSDHRYILISFEDEDERSRRNLLRGNQEEDPSRPRWAIKRMHEDRLITAAQATAWAASSQEMTSWDAERKAEWFQAQMTRVCDASMPRVRNARRKATYWWSPELEERRRECVITRRRYQHKKRKATATSEKLEQTRLGYRQAVAALAGEGERRAVVSFCEEVMSAKEAAERKRERTDPGRRKRRRRRPPSVPA